MDTHALLFPLPWSVFVLLSLVMLPVIWVVSFSWRIRLTQLPLLLLAPQYLVGLAGIWKKPKYQTAAFLSSAFGSAFIHVPLKMLKAITAQDLTCFFKVNLRSVIYSQFGWKTKKLNCHWLTFIGHNFWQDRFGGHGRRKCKMGNISSLCEDLNTGTISWLEAKRVDRYATKAWQYFFLSFASRTGVLGQPSIQVPLISYRWYRKLLYGEWGEIITDYFATFWKFN